MSSRVTWPKAAISPDGGHVGGDLGTRVTYATRPRPIRHARENFGPSRRIQVDRIWSPISKNRVFWERFF
ncbi:hypothetical protein GEV33_000272 [Tenebrio molitor]|uniref:Uncharacterized protein n=1 Tax=Tenebrio molitor TaxID=7067 RepID=A0A8J6LH45_TENMO|nr:hypothetical protein GEV33_000272 [Tenebrio molitor]